MSKAEAKYKSQTGKIAQGSNIIPFPGVSLPVPEDFQNRLGDFMWENFQNKLDGFLREMGYIE